MTIAHAWFWCFCTCGGLNLNVPTGASPYLIPWNDAYFSPLFVKIQEPIKHVVVKQIVGEVVWPFENMKRKHRINMIKYIFHCCIVAKNLHNCHIIQTFLMQMHQVNRLCFFAFFARDTLYIRNSGLQLQYWQMDNRVVEETKSYLQEIHIWTIKLSKMIIVKSLMNIYHVWIWDIPE